MGTRIKASRPGDARLAGWKEIAAHFGRDERTVKRWESRRGLPLHRLPGNGSAGVYAYTGELDGWLGRGRALDVSSELEAPIPAPSAPASVLASGRLSFVAIGAVAILVLGMLLVGSGLVPNPLRSADASRAHIADPVAAELYNTGVYYWHTRTPQGLNRAIDYFTQAIVRDPGYAQAYAGLADCYNLLREFSVMSPSEAYPRAKAAAERAIALNPHLADAHAALAFVDFYGTRDTISAKREFEMALRLAPNSAITRHWYATMLMTLGEYHRALAQIDSAQAIDPASTAILADRGLILFYAGHADEAETLLRQMEDSAPRFLSPHSYLAFIYETRGEDQAYLRELGIAARLLHDPSRVAIAQAGQKGLAAGGRNGMLQAILAQQQRLCLNGKATAFDLAHAYARLKMYPQALATLQTSASRHEAQDVALMLDPAFAPLHDQPAFRAIVQRAGLPSPS